MHTSTSTTIFRCLLTICSSLLLLANCVIATADDLQVAGSPDRQVTIVMLGDSITKGVRSGVNAEQTFAALVEKGLMQKGITTRVINAGIGGERTDQALKRLEQALKLAMTASPTW